jgi:hypothetical protein
MATKTKTAKRKTATKKRARGRAPEPYTVTELRDVGDSVLHVSKRVRTAIGTGIGASFGALIGQAFGEDPERFMSSIRGAFEQAGEAGGLKSLEELLKAVREAKDGEVASPSDPAASPQPSIPSPQSAARGKKPRKRRASA